VFADNSTDVIIKDDYIHVYDSVIANFHALPTEVFVGEAVQFFDDSRGDQLQWEWDFGDGNTSQLQSPEHTYGMEGIFSIKLKISNGYFQDSVTRENYINVVEPLISGFIADTTRVLVGQQIQFTDLSLGGPTFRIWDFGDNTVTFNQNPQHSYSQTGTYTVSLEIFRGDSSDIAIREDYIQVRDTLIAGFYAVSTAVRAGDPLQFFDVSRGEPNQWLWDFGEGKNYTVPNPVFVYQNPGIYSVQLIVKNDFDTDSILIQNYITVLPRLVSQSIVLADGWSGMSTCINPLDAAIEELLSPLGEKHFFSMNHAGIYWPSENTNTISIWNPYDGLIIKMDGSDTLTIVGEEFLNAQLEIQAGWNILPVVNTCEEYTMMMHEKLGDTLVLIKEIAGNKVFWPEYGINTLEQLEAGRSYYSLTNFETSYHFQSCDGELNFKESGDDQITFNPWNDFTMTPRSHLVAIEPGSIRFPANTNGNICIGVFNNEGVCSGVTNIKSFSESKAYVLVAFGRENGSSKYSGFSEGDEMTFKIYNEQARETRGINVSFNEDFPDGGIFRNNGMSGISQVEINVIDDINLQQLEIFIYPNPGRGIFHVDLSTLNEPYTIEVLNARGAILKPKLIESDGVTTIDISGKAKGIYLVRITSAHQSTIKKIVLR
jgi:PKD repeat protein